VSLVSLVALGALVAALALVVVVVVSRAARRMVVTSWVASSAAGSFLGRRLRGERGAGPSELRRAFEELGPTYIKLGQIIASSPGLFPETWCVEFRKCLDRVRPFPFAEARAIVAEELGRPIEEVFASIDEQPLASASIAQVHAARLRDGTNVVLKIQRPGIRSRVDDDLRILHRVAAVLGRTPMVKLSNPIGIVDDFDSTIHRELDFVAEAANMDEFNRIMAELGHADVVAPRVHHALTTRRVLTMERFHGIRVDDVAAIRARGIDGEAKLLLGMRAWFQCMIFHGFFHGDVHAGNLMALDDGRIGFLDFGIVGRFPPIRRAQITDYLVAFASADFHRVAEVMVAMGTVDERVDLDELAKDLEVAYRPMLSMSFADLNYAALLPSVLRVSTKHRMHLPSEFVLVTKQMLYFDRYAKLLAPNLNIFRDPRLLAGLMTDIARARELFATLGVH